MDAGEVRVYASLRVDAAFEIAQALVPQTIRHALQYLDMARERLLLLGLFQHYFPRQFAESNASPYLAPGQTGYSDAEGELLELVLRHLFPIAEAMDGDERFEGIPIIPVGVSTEDHDEEDQVYAVLSACGGGFDTAWPEVFVNWPVELPGLDPVGVKGGYDKTRFEVLCNERGGLYRNVPVALRVCAHDTGNWFLDATDEMVPEMPPWSFAMVETLRQEWAEADKMLGPTGDLAKWLRDEPEAMVTVIEMLNESVPPESKTQAEDDPDGEVLETDAADPAEGGE
jgi:hypothetical protein